MIAFAELCGLESFAAVAVAYRVAFVVVVPGVIPGGVVGFATLEAVSNNPFVT